MKTDNKRVVKIEGVEVRKCSDDFLSSKLGTYRATLTVARIAGAGFFLFFLIWGATWSDPAFLLMCAGLGLVMASIFWGFSWPLVSKIKAIREELDRRVKKDSSKKELLSENEKNSGNRYKVIAVAAVAVGLVLALVFIVLMNGGKDEGCSICGRDAALVPGYDFCYNCFENIVD